MTKRSEAKTKNSIICLFDELIRKIFGVAWTLDIKTNEEGHVLYSDMLTNMFFFSTRKYSTIIRKIPNKVYTDMA